MTRILLVHGWCFDATIWADVADSLRGHQCVTVDFGYFGTSRMDLPEDLDLVVGHSFGGLWAMQQPQLEGVPLLTVNGFTRFAAAPDFLHGTPVRVLQRMTQRLREAPEEALRAFRECCGGPPPPPPPLHLSRLKEDLDHLLHDDARGLSQRQPLRALAADDDPLLPVVMSEAMFPGILRRLPHGGHLLPLTAPGAVADFIREGLYP
jgi:pimeloyl-[acyl-carrier protein] methyl ester esterase